MVAVSAQVFSEDIFSVAGHPTMQKVYDKLRLAIREHLSSNHLLEYKANVLGPIPDPGIRGSKQVTVDYYGWVILVVRKA